jgi:hypothetical protein
MTRILLSGLVLGALSSAAVAQPVALGEAQLDKITAGEAIAVAVTCVDGRCQTVESRGPIAAVACVNGRCQVIR